MPDNNRDLSSSPSPPGIRPFSCGSCVPELATTLLALFFLSAANEQYQKIDILLAPPMSSNVRDEGREAEGRVEEARVWLRVFCKSAFGLETSSSFNAILITGAGESFNLFGERGQTGCLPVFGEMGVAMNHVRIQEGATIENPRGYDGLAVGSLERRLQSGAPAKSDPRRRYFYEIEGDAETYYIHISPITGNVTLLAKWLHLPQDCCADPSCAYA